MFANSQTFNSKSRAHFILKDGRRVPWHLQAAVVAPAVLQSDAADAQREVVLPRVPLQAVALVLAGPGLATVAVIQAGTQEEDGGAGAVAQPPHHLDGGVVRVVRVGEGAGQHHGVALDGPHLSGHYHGPAVIKSSGSCSQDR